MLQDQAKARRLIAVERRNSQALRKAVRTASLGLLWCDCATGQPSYRCAGSIPIQPRHAIRNCRWLSVPASSAQPPRVATLQLPSPWGLCAVQPWKISRRRKAGGRGQRNMVRPPSIRCHWRVPSGAVSRIQRAHAVSCASVQTALDSRRSSSCRAETSCRPSGRPAAPVPQGSVRLGV